ncbi:REB1 (YBR049C) and NSI1 (YDR026C) [Zygosaccharomyces parabailii]|nr:REB1 (YBR049C) and NSI1 (YDR026C) [Zygosaccharomyces parabailii]CDH10308.1 related to DNA-binding protein REB1 [Zygosaccharomyces bailii ISA1307]
MASNQEKQYRGQVHHLPHEGGSRHESVEEAVFKYVGVGLHNEEDDPKESKPYDKREVNDTGKSGNANQGSEMDWLFRNAHNDEDIGGDASENSSRGFQSVALAAIAAAYGSGDPHQKRERGKEVDEPSDDDAKKHRAFKKPKKNNDKRAKLQLAVDPELATLDDSDVTGHDQLVRKAIIDTDSIAQHPDFQQYLNTEEEPHKLKNSSKNKNKVPHGGENGPSKDDRDVDPAVVEAGARQGGQDDNLEDVTKQYAELQKDSVMDSPVTKSLQKKDYREVLPKVMSSAEIGVDTDVSHLIQSAASKASAIIGTTSQSSGKSFDQAEEAALEQFITEYQTIKNLDRQQICERIWSNERRKDDFWSNICKVLPYRTRSSIYKHVRRKYHIFEQRGKWTPQEDNELARLCVEKEGQWSEIGRALGRMPEDCRDRWRNYVKCGSNRASNKWSPQEEELLKRVITEMLEEAQRHHTQSTDRLVQESDEEDDVQASDDEKSDYNKKNRKSNNRASFKDVINWTIVSERMGGTRSRIQCRYKWNKLVKKEAIAKIQSITDSDKRWILEKLRDLGFTEDSQVDWEELAALKPGVKWTGTELKLCYERMRSGVRYYKQKSINDISKELLVLLDGALPLESDTS